MHKLEEGNEWSSYIPYGGGKHGGSGASIPIGTVVYQDEPSRTKVKRPSKSHRCSRGPLYSPSQSISSSELQSVAGPARLTNEASEATTSLSALESKMVDSFDPNQRTHEVYADLDPEEDGNDEIDYPIRHDHEDATELSGISYSEGYPRSQRSSAMGGASDRQSQGGTCNLALDGKDDGRS